MRSWTLTCPRENVCRTVAVALIGGQIVAGVGGVVAVHLADDIALRIEREGVEHVIGCSDRRAGVVAHTPAVRPIDVHRRERCLARGRVVSLFQHGLTIAVIQKVGGRRGGTQGLGLEPAQSVAILESREGAGQAPARNARQAILRPSERSRSNPGSYQFMDLDRR
jgi:hypothetical protein